MWLGNYLALGKGAISQLSYILKPRLGNTLSHRIVVTPSQDKQFEQLLVKGIDRVLNPRSHQEIVENPIRPYELLYVWLKGLAITLTRLTITVTQSQVKGIDRVSLVKWIESL